MKNISEQTITNMSDFQTLKNSSYEFKRNLEIIEIKKLINELLNDFGLKGLECISYYNNYISICGKNFNGFNQDHVEKIIHEILCN